MKRQCHVKGSRRKWGILAWNNWQ